MLEKYISGITCPYCRGMNCKTMPKVCDYYTCYLEQTTYCLDCGESWKLYKEE